MAQASWRAKRSFSFFSRTLITVASVAHQIIGVSHHEVIVAHAMTVLDVVPRHHATIPRHASPTTDSTINPMHIKGLSMLLLLPLLLSLLLRVRLLMIRVVL